MKKADEILSAFFRMYNLEDGAEYVSFFESWQEIVGVDLASHSRVADIQNGAAIVEMDHPGWMQMLQMKEQKFVRAIQKRFPDLGVERLSLRLVDQATWERRAGARKPAGDADGPRPAADAESGRPPETSEGSAPAAAPRPGPAAPDAAADQAPADTSEGDTDGDRSAGTPDAAGAGDPEVPDVPSPRLRESLSRLKEDLQELDEESDDR